MTKRQLLARLRKCAIESIQEPERAHRAADALIIEYLDDPEIEKAFNQVDKWYA